MYNINDVHNESLDNKKPKKKMYGQSSTELKTYTEENTCEKYIEQNISQKKKPEMNDLLDISLVDKYSMDNDHVAIKKPKKKKNHNKSLNSNTSVHCKTYEKYDNHNINNSDSTGKNMSELNALATKKPKKNKKHDNSLDLNSDINEPEFKSSERSSVEVREQIINGSDSIENVKTLSSKKKYIKSLNLIELNSINNAEIKPLERTCKEMNGQNIIDSYSRTNVNRKRKSEINGLLDISLSDNCSIDNENVPTKKTKKEKNHDRSLNSVELNTNHDTEIQTFERTHEEVNDSDNSNNIIQIIRSELNASSNISLENKYSIDKNNAVTKKSKKEKKHNKSLNSMELNTIIDTDCQTYEKIINAKLTKKPKKKNYNKSLNSTKLDTNHDKQIQKLEKSFDEVNDQNINDSDYRENANQRIKSKLNTSTDVFLENKCSMDNDNVATKKPNKKKKHNGDLKENNLHLDSEIQIFERTYEEVDDSDNSKNVIQVLKSELNTSSNISLKNKCNMDKNNAVTKKSKKEKKHNKSLNSMELNTNIGGYFKTYEKNNEFNINGFDYKEKNIIQKDIGNDCINDNENIPTKNHHKSINMIELNTINDADCPTNEKNDEQNVKTLADISLGNDFNNDSENIPTKNHKKKKNNKSLNSIDLNTNHDTEIKTFERTCKEVSEPNMNDSTTKELSFASSEINYSLGNENTATKKRKKHKKNFNSVKLNTINDADCQTYEKNNEQKINDLPTRKPINKKNHDESLNSIELDTNHDKEIQMLEKTYEEVNDSNYRESVSQRIKSKLNTSIDSILENKCSIDIDIAASKKPNKKKNHNKSLSSIEFNTNNDSYFRTYEKNNELNINCFDSKENMIQKQMSEMNTLADISLGNDCNNDTDNILTKYHTKNLNINTNHDTEFKTFERTCIEVSEPNMNDSDTKELSSASLEISYNLDTENIATKESKNRKKHDILKTVISDCTDKNKMLSQNQCELKTLLNSLEKYNFEESSTIDKTNINLKHFNLIKYLINKDPSLKNHPNFKRINEYLSKKIKLTINTKCEVGPSDILLLKTVGKIILKKIVEKIDSAQDIKDLVIKLPVECQENKIHFMETTLSRLPNKLKMDIIKEHNPLIKLRVFNKDEDKMIREYWSKFQKEYNISNILPFLSNGVEMALSPKERLQFIRYISAGLPNRLLYSVFNRFNILFNAYQDKTSFSEEEDQLIIKVDKCDAIRNKFAVLSLILNRTRLQLYRRIEALRNQHKECKKVLWDDQKRQELFTNILLETNTEDWKHLKSLTITKDIWIKIAKNLGDDFTYKKVRYQWNYLYTMLFCEKPILMSTFNLTILELLEQINAKHWSDLDWIEITNKLYPGANSKVICTFFHSWIDKRVPSNIKESVRDTLNYLQCHEVDKLKSRIDKYGEREFPRLTVKHFDLLVNNQ